MVISQATKVSVSVVNYKLPGLHIKAEVYCRRPIKCGTMPTSVSRAPVASVQARYSVRIGAAMQRAAAQLMHGGRRRHERVCTVHLRLTQLLCRDQSTLPARPIAAGLRVARIKLR